MKIAFLGLGDMGQAIVPRLLAARVLRNGTEIASINEPQGLHNLTGELVDTVRHTANLLAVFGEKLQVEPGEEIVFHFAPVDMISVRFASASS